MKERFMALTSGLRRDFNELTAAIRAPNNDACYVTPDAVDLYSHRSALQGPERAIVNRLGKWLAGRRMLDIGVGGGRTTLHFAPLVATYVGIDYSPPMITACKARIGNEMDNITFAVGDVRDLSSFNTGAFDFVLFSYNGLDYIGHDDRLRAFSELHRVCAPSGFVCFSSHNLGFVPELFRLGPHRPANAYRRARRRLLLMVLRLRNRPRRLLAQDRYAIVHRPPDEFGAMVYYVRPSEQLTQLDRAGLAAVDVYGLDGRRIALAKVDDARDQWLYYLATPKRHASSHPSC